MSITSGAERRGHWGHSAQAGTCHRRCHLSSPLSVALALDYRIRPPAVAAMTVHELASAFLVVMVEARGMRQIREMGARRRLRSASRLDDTLRECLKISRYLRRLGNR